MAALAAPIMAAVKGIGMAKALMVGSTVLSAAGAIQQGKAAKAASAFEATQLVQAGKAEKAAASAEAQEERRKKDLLISRARAVGAASGGGQDLDLLGAIEEEGERRALTAVWGGEERAKGRNTQAAAARAEGGMLARAGAMRAGTTLLDGGYSFLEKYG